MERERRVDTHTAQSAPWPTWSSYCSSARWLCSPLIHHLDAELLATRASYSIISKSIAMLQDAKRHTRKRVPRLAFSRSVVQAVQSPRGHD
eukprot:3420343-Amphidinium_carterae.4